MKLYIDADVWLNFWQDEMLGFIPASHYAEELLEKALKERWAMVISEEVKKEIKRAGISMDDLEEKLSDFRLGNILEEVEVEERDAKLARKIFMERGLHASDAMHAALAIKSKAIFVTRNIKHFKVVQDILEVRKPEDLL